MARKRLFVVAGGGVLLLMLVVGLFLWPGWLLSAEPAEGTGTSAAGPPTTRITPSTGASAPSGAPPSPRAGGPVPAEAASVAAKLVGGTPTDQRETLVAPLATVLPTGAPFPPGSTLALDADSWLQSDTFASATGVVSEPGSPPLRIEIGFVMISGRWSVTYTEPTP